MRVTDLEEQFTFYASYHHNGINKLIHIVCVWPILWTALVMIQYVPLEAPWSNPIHPVNAALVFAAIYGSLYFLMDQKAGSLAALMVAICLITSRSYYLNNDGAWVTALGIHIACWIAQFIGHGAFEGRAPALMDNVPQALLMGPFFVLLEVLFSFGYRKDMQAKMWRNVERELSRLKSQNKSAKGRK